MRSGKTCQHNRSMQHLLEAFYECTRLILFASVDLNGTLPCLGYD